MGRRPRCCRPPDLGRRGPGPPVIVDAVVPARPLAAAAAGVGHANVTNAGRPAWSVRCRLTPSTSAASPSRRSPSRLSQWRTGRPERADRAARRRPGRQPLHPPRRRRAADQLVGDVAGDMSFRRSTYSVVGSTRTRSATASSSWASPSRRWGTNTSFRPTGRRHPGCRGPRQRDEHDPVERLPRSTIDRDAARPDRCGGRRRCYAAMFALLRLVPALIAALAEVD